MSSDSEESGPSNPSRRSRQPLLGACDLHFVAVGDSESPGLCRLDKYSYL